MEETKGYNLRTNPTPTMKRKEMEEQRKKKITEEPNTEGEYVTFVETDSEESTMEFEPLNTREVGQAQEEIQSGSKDKEEISTNKEDEIMNMLKLLMINMNNMNKELKADNNELNKKLEENRKELKEELKENNKELNKRLEENNKELNKRLEENNKELKEKMEELKSDNIKLYNNLEEINKTLTENRAELKQDIFDVNAKCEESNKVLKQEMQIMNTKLENKVNKVENTCEELQITMKKTKDEVEKQVEEKLKEYKPETTIPTIYINYDSQQENMIPKFNGRSTNPMEFLKELVRHISQVEEQRRMEKREPIEWKSLLDRALEEGAVTWWQTIRDEIRSVEEFMNRFREKYWGDDIQEGIKNRIEYEKYREGGRKTRAEYFLERVIILKNLTPTPGEEEIVKRLSRHFDYEIQTARRLQNVNTVREMEKLLNAADIDQNNEQIRRRGEEAGRRNLRENVRPQRQNWYDGNRQSWFERNGNNNGRYREVRQPRYAYEQRRPNYNQGYEAPRRLGDREMAGFDDGRERQEENRKKVKEKGEIVN